MFMYPKREDCFLKDNIVTIDVFDGYRYGIDNLFVEGKELLTIGTKMHKGICFLFKDSDRIYL